MAEKAEELADGDRATPPVPVSFFNPAFKDVRKRAFLLWSRTRFILCLFVLGVLSIFWGSQFATERITDHSRSGSTTLTARQIEFFKLPRAC